MAHHAGVLPPTDYDHLTTMRKTHLRLLALPAALQLVGCNQLLGTDDLKVTTETAESSYACQTHFDCVGQSDAASAICVQPTGRCVPLLSEDCTSVTGDPTADGAIVIGSLFPLTGPQEMASLHRQQSVALAVEQINAVGGIPHAGNAAESRRPLALVSCNTANDLTRAANHLVKELNVPAIVGPSYSQDVLDLSNTLTVQTGTVLVSPTAVASSIADLIDRDLSWLMVPTDVQRAPLMIQQINAIEARARQEGGVEQVKLAVAFRDDALGVGTRTSLNDLVLNGKPLADPTNFGVNIRMNPYDGSASNQSDLVAAYLSFAPHIIVLAGTAEAVTQIMLPLEQQWTGDARPEYVLIDSLKLPELIDAVRDNPGLRGRIRGSGVSPTPESAPVYDAFLLDYKIRYPMSMGVVSGMPRAYDATFAIAYAIAASSETLITGATIAKGFQKLDSGSVMELTSTRILAAFRELAAGRNIRAVGAFGPLSWNRQGAIAAGILEVWCIGLADGMPAYESSGLTFDMATGTFEGEYTPCD